MKKIKDLGLFLCLIYFEGFEGFLQKPSACSLLKNRGEMSKIFSSAVQSCSSEGFKMKVKIELCSRGKRLHRKGQGVHRKI